LNHTEKALELILAKLDTLQPQPQQQQQQQQQQQSELRRRKTQESKELDDS